MKQTPRITLVTVVVALAIGLGAVIRVWLVLARHALTEDDATLALNIAARSFADLVEPIQYAQVAPILHLWLLRLAVELGGVSDVALRSVPLLAGLVLPFAAWRLARRLLDPWPAALVAAFVALAPILIRYSAHIKPYQLDALVTVIVAGFTLDVLERPDDSAGWWRLAVAGLVALLASLTAPFLLAGAGTALAWSAYSRVPRSRAGLQRVGALGLLWGIAFAALYAALYRETAASTYMQEFWDASFLTPRAFGPGGAGWTLLARLPLETFARSRVVLPLYLLAWGLLVLGAVHLARRRGGGVALLLAVPIAAALIASAFRRYPISQRLFLYAAPLVMVLIVSGLFAVRARWPGRWVARGVGAVAAVWVLALVAMAPVDPVRYEGMRQLVAELRTRRQPGVPVYVFAGAIPAWTFYDTDWSAPDRERIAFIARNADLGGPAFANAPPRGRPLRADEGNELAFCTGGALELLGLSTGMHARDFTIFVQPQPDSGWAEREADRIVAAARPDIWLVFANAYWNTAPDLLAALRARGAKVVEGREWRVAKLYRYRVDRGPASQADSPCGPTS